MAKCPRRPSSLRDDTSRIAVRRLVQIGVLRFAFWFCASEFGFPLASLAKFHYALRMIEHTTRIRVRYADTDQMHVAYYARYLEWFEVGRTELLRARALPYAEIEKYEVALPVLEVYCKYRKPARYDQLLRVISRLKSMPRASLRIDYEIFDEAEQLLAEGHTVHTFINMEGKPVRPPQVFIQKLKEFF